MVSNQSIIKIISNIKPLLFDNCEMIISPGDTFKNLYLVKQGEITCLDKRLNYQCHLQEGSFFGLYNIMFGLYSSKYFRYIQKDHSNLQSPCILFKLPHKTFLSVICEDYHSFTHFHKIAIQ